MSGSLGRTQLKDRYAVGVLCLVLAVLQILDLHSSLHAAASGRTESNPLIRWTMSQIGFVPALVVFKLVALVCVGAYYMASRKLRWGWRSSRLLLVISLVYLAIVLNNYS